MRQRYVGDGAGGPPAGHPVVVERNRGGVGPAMGGPAALRGLRHRTPVWGTTHRCHEGRASTFCVRCVTGRLLRSFDHHTGQPGASGKLGHTSENEELRRRPEAPGARVDEVVERQATTPDLAGQVEQGRVLAGHGTVSRSLAAGRSAILDHLGITAPEPAPEGCALRAAALTAPPPRVPAAPGRTAAAPTVRSARRTDGPGRRRRPGGSACSGRRGRGVRRHGGGP